jgi:outer membrane protein TolC
VTRLALSLAGPALALAGCSADYYAEDADREVGQILADTREAALGERATWVQYPLQAPEPPAEPAPAAAPEGGQAAHPAGGEAGAPEAVTPEEVTQAEAAAALQQPAEPAPAPTPAAAVQAPAVPPPEAPAAEILQLDLARSLEIATTTGRDYLDRRDSIFQQGLALSLVRYNFGPLLNSTIAYLWSDHEDSADQDKLAATLGLTQILPTGGTFGISGLLNTTHGDDVVPDDDGLPPFDTHDTFFDSGLSVSLVQPLARGAGYEVSHEALTQAERDTVYAVRDFELFREDFSIGIAADFFDLVSRGARLVNLKQHVKDAEYDRTKAEALRQVDRNKDEDVFLARRRLIDAESELLSAQTDYEAAVDDFKIRLGLPADTPVTIADVQPVLLPVALDEASAVEVALHNRLDLLTGEDRVADRERQVRNARNGLLPDVGLALNYNTIANHESFGQGAVPDEWNATAALTVGLPLQRQAERNIYRNALIELDQSRRDLDLQHDQVERDIVNQLRDLRQIEQQIDLQNQQIAQEQRAVAVMEIRYEAGDVENRDLLDARQSLLDAQNQLIDLLARHFIARLRLLRNLGVLFIDDKGMWVT